VKGENVWESATHFPKGGGGKRKRAASEMNMAVRIDVAAREVGHRNLSFWPNVALCGTHNSKGD
jgi:hypothetical protein